MNKDYIIRMAKQAGFERLGHDDYDYVCYPDDILAFAELVASAEREACAKVCENIYEGDEACGDWPTPEMCANAIRARGQA